MFRLLCYGLVAAAFFSSTFVLNRQMATEGWHWYWTAALRYVWMAVLLVAYVAAVHKRRGLRNVWQAFREHLLLWVVTGTIGFGLFYAAVCFAAAYSPSWVLASTWQLTVVATPLTLALFGARVPWRGYAFSVMVFAGVVLVNWTPGSGITAQTALCAIAPIVVAAFAYPVGNNIIYFAKNGGHKYFHIPHVQNGIVQESAFALILLSTLGSMAGWAGLYAVVRPPAPSLTQVAYTAIIALCSGVIATGFLWHARNDANNSGYRIAAVDSTQAGETVFTAAFGVLIFGEALPHARGVIGMLLIIAGIFFFSLFERTKERRLPAT